MKNSFKYAINGFLACVRSERNMRVHLAFTFYVLLAAAVTGISRTEWCVVILCAGVVTAAEIVNTAIERLCDSVSYGFSKDIGLVKDLAAGAVLTVSAASAAAGGIIFFAAERLNAAEDFMRRYPLFSILILATVPIAVFLVFRRYDNDK